MKKKIIIAEDSPTQAENLKFNLEELGYEAEIATNGMIALNLVKTTTPDLVISDILMPVMDGYTLCNAIKSDGRLQHIPVILLSSLSDSSDVIKGLVSGADNFISKPIDEDSLGRVVATMLENPGTDETVSELNEFSVTMEGTAYTLTASHEKMLRFLLSTYDTAILKNQSLLTAQRDLSDLNKTLESKVASRTAELAKEVEERKRAEQSIRERERVIREITENLRELVFKTDLEGIYLWVNSAHAIYAGYSQVELIGRSFFEFIHPEDQDEVIKLFRERMAEGIQYAVEFKFQHAEGHFIWMECTANYIPGETDASGSIVFAAHEITERKDFENELIQGREKALKSDLLKSSFLANMSHDIRTPMNAIIGFSELLKEQDLQEEDRAKFLDQITKNGESLLNLVNDIIDVSKIEAGVLAIHKASCPVNQICQELYEFYAGHLSYKNKNEVTLSFAKGFDDMKQLIVTDPLRFRQIMSNLIGNAVKFTDHGRIEFGYTLSDEKTLEFFVRDSGIGIPREDHDRIFDQFARVESVMEQNQGGTGLGLSISRNLATLMGGKMWVESKVGEGSTFYFTLPYEPVKESFIVPPSKPKRKILPDLSGKKILIVEDDFSCYSYLQAALNKLKVDLLWAKDGEAAVDFCRERSDIDLVLMDIQLPKLTGFEATPLIKAARPDLPVIAQTAYTMSGEEKKCYEAGCDDYLAKPIIPSDLVDKVCKFLVNNNEL